jgi:branched-chain amino acid transport system substrate-binding protein
MARQNGIPRALRRHAFVGFAFSSALSVLGCDAIVDTKGRASCSTNSECTSRFGEPSACVESACVKLLSTECTEVWPADALTQDNAILIGYLGETTTGDKYGAPPRDGMKLALKEIETKYDGFPGVSADSARRHLAMLVCNHGADPDQVARHLVQDAKVQVIVGASFSGTTLTVFNDVARPANVLMLSPSATSPALTNLDDKGLLWRTAPSDVVQAELLKFLKLDVEDLLHAKGALAADVPATVVMPTKDDSAGHGLADAARDLNPTLMGGAPPITEPLTAFLYDDPAKNPDMDWQPYNQKTIAANPDIIMAMGTGEFVTYMLPQIEMNWDTTKHRRPWYVLPEGDRGDDLLKFAADHPDLNPPVNERVIGAAPGARRSRLYQGFRDRFKQLFNDQPGNLAEFGYDAGYLVLYAIAIAKKDSPTGPELANALKFVSCKDGPTVPAGSADQFSTAAEHGCIDFDGASGPLDFNPDTGEAVSDIAMWCLHRKGSGFSFEPTLDSYYSAESNSVAVAEGGTALDLSSDGWCGPGQ